MRADPTAKKAKKPRETNRRGEFLIWLSENRQLTRAYPIAKKVEEPKGTNRRGTKCIVNGRAICTKCILKLVGGTH
jgi:hypothetical protein